MVTENGNLTQLYWNVNRKFLVKHSTIIIHLVRPSCAIYYFKMIILVKVTDCDAPFNFSGVNIEPFNDTILGSLITFRCDNLMTAVCGSDGEWSPNPASSKKIHTHT